MNTAEQIEAAWALLQQPGKWTQWAYAKDSAGCRVPVNSTAAVSFCSLGALARQANLPEGCPLLGLKPYYYLQRAANMLEICSVAAANDSAKSIQDLAPMWELAIKLAKEAHEQEASP